MERCAANSREYAVEMSWWATAKRFVAPWIWWPRWPLRVRPWWSRESRVPARSSSPALSTTRVRGRRGNLLQPADFDRPIQEAPTQAYNLEAVERLAIERALAATGGNRTRAARLLGISERTLRNKLNTPRAASED